MAKNVLLICADDLYDWDRYRTRWGVTVPTPNFDRLLARGTKFANAFAPIAVCHPTRTATMSGYTPWQTGIFNNFTPTETVLTLDQIWPMAFRKAGYVMGSIGKVYHNTGEGYGADPAPWTFPLYDQVPTILSVGPNAGEHTATNFGGALGGLGFETGDAEFFDAQVAATFETFIATYDEDRPFYFECGFFHPHEPRNAPIRFFEAVDYDNLTPPADWEDGWNTATFAADVFVNKPMNPPSTWSAAQLESWKGDVGNYLAAVMHLDHQLGRVLDALEASDHDDNTIVAFFSDHGYELWSHGHFQKFTLWEQSCAVPLVICDPDSSGGQVVTRPVSVMDVGPTLLDLAGLEVPSHHAGMSLKAAVEGGAAPARMILSAWYSGASGRTDTHRITVYSDGSTEYFDLAADPWTQENLAPSNPAGMVADRATLLATAQEWGLLIVEEGVDISAPTPFAVYLGAAEQTKTKVGRAFVAYGDLKAEHLPRGRKKVWVQPGVQNDVLRVPFGVEAIGVPHHLAGSKDTFTIHANAEANTFDIQDLNASFNLTMHLGEGDDRIEDIYGAYVVYAGPGNDYLWTWRSSPQEWHGGAGDDEMRGGSAGDLFVGGPGNDLLQGIGGADTLIGGPGDDTMEGGAGNDRLVLDGGSNQAAGGAGVDTFVIHRTARLQTITNFDASDIIDLGDWANIGPVTVAQAGADVTITAALERIVVNSATAAAVASSITGVAVA